MPDLRIALTAQFGRPHFILRSFIEPRHMGQG